ncbi:MAG: hypothetical protein CBC48_10105 [bacterium TMED88]|nr:MAG: hypothetical protein CBC48_10105 [bacterium TMED88]
MNFLNTFWYNTTGASTFETKWRTTLNNQSITLPYVSSGTYSGTIDWGDGTVVANTYANRSHTYINNGDYNVVIDGECSKWNFATTNTSASKIIEVLGWGTYSFEESVFNNCGNFIGGPVCRDIINLSPNANLSFSSCGSLTTIQNIEFWDVSNLTRTQAMFMNCIQFTGDLSNWDISNVTNAFFMLGNCSSFNSDISSWDTSSLVLCAYMFVGCSSFNSDINFDLTSATSTAYGLFSGCTSFNGDMSGMDTSTLTSMRDMFTDCTSLNNNSMMGWDVSNVTDMINMFESCSSFNQDFTTWNTSNVTTMQRMFSNADVFNGNVDVFDTSSVNDMSFMFANADAFDQDFSNWDISATGLSMQGFMFGKTFNNYSAANYDILLSRCQSGGLSNVTLDMGTIKYTSSGEARKNDLVNNFGWTITDGGLV